jgi:branched-chain amino acid aminotransferase
MENVETLNGTIKITPVSKSKLSEVDFNHLEFGKIISDHMLITEFSHGKWRKPEIAPYGNISCAPAMLAFHYGQIVFEGMKAFKMKDGNISIFRIDKHHERFGKSLERMCMPVIPYDYFLEGLAELIRMDALWVPGTPGASLYIRPFIFASEERFGVKISDEYLFMTFTGPVEKVYRKSIRAKIEDRYIRAAPGGTGSAKCAGNYGGSFYPTKLANQQGYDQLIWTDKSPELFIEESGVMNIMFVIDGVLVTPPPSDTILEGVTRDSFLRIARDNGIKVDERKISALELKQCLQKGTVQEAFGTGTAAVSVPFNTIAIQNKDYALPAESDKSVRNIITLMLENMRHGIAADRYGWNTIVKP